MCGITGMYSFSGFADEQAVYGFTQSLSHRGPDASGVYVRNNVALGHTRLSILDLSEKANQPMTSHNGRYVMVYNGEVYNYREIAAELKQHNTGSFNTSSDSEIILEAFSVFGIDFLQKLNGMFAIAIYDTEKNELLLIRDRLGIKPLYYGILNDTLIFASELKVFQQHRKACLSLNTSAVNHFLHAGYIPAPYSIYNEVQKLEQGTYIKISCSGVEKISFWSPENVITEHYIRKEKEATVKLSDLLASSVQYQLKSDVPFGIFLSGGVDSSLLAAQAAAISSLPVNTFSIGFTESRYDESGYAEKIANYLHTKHHTFLVSEHHAVELFTELLQTFDEPFADSSAIPTMLLSKLAKEHVTVCLSGEGGDELFFGYGAYKWANRLSNPLVSLLRNPIQQLLAATKKYERHAAYFEKHKAASTYAHIFSQEQYYFSENELSFLLTNDFLSRQQVDFPILNDFSLSLDKLPRRLNAMEKQAIADIRFYLPGDLLTKVDRASMKYALETRVPYLDHRLVEFALNLSPALKYKNGIQKYILKQVLYQYVPETFFNRPKQGFAIPLASWLKHDLHYLIPTYLSEEIVRNYNIVNYSVVQHLLTDFNRGKTYLYNRIWQLILLHKFLKDNNL